MPFRTIIGIDPSLSSTGLARIRGGHVDTAVRGSKPPPAALSQDWDLRDERLGGLVRAITAWCLPEGVDPKTTLVVMETPAYSKIAGHAHDRAGLWWRLFAALRAQGCTMMPLTPQHRMKYATGKGNSQKDFVLAAAIRRYPHLNITGNDVADAVLLADIAARLDGQPLLPQIKLSKLCWPLPKMPALPASPEVNPFATRS